MAINLRVTTAEAQKIQYCADKLETSRTDAIVSGIDLLKTELDKK